VELTGGEELQLGNTGTGEGGIASGHNLALAPRAVRRIDGGAFAFGALVAPGASGRLGLSEVSVGFLVVWTFGT
jgi:hypothetical protein